MDGHFDSSARIVIGNIAARCARCGGEKFIRGKTRQLRADVLVCSACGAQNWYTDLLRQIAEEAISRCEKTLRDGRALRQRVRESQTREPDGGPKMAPGGEPETSSGTKPK